MTNISLTEEQLKALFKQALLELLEEKQSLFTAILEKALEEIGWQMPIVRVERTIL